MEPNEPLNAAPQPDAEEQVAARAAAARTAKLADRYDRKG